MRRIVRRTDTIITTQTWTVTWTEDIPAGEPSPALLPGPAPEAPAPAPDTSPALPPQDGGAE